MASKRSEDEWQRGILMLFLNINVFLMDISDFTTTEFLKTKEESHSIKSIITERAAKLHGKGGTNNFFSHNILENFGSKDIKCTYGTSSERRSNSLAR